MVIDEISSSGLAPEQLSFSRKSNQRAGMAFSVIPAQGGPGKLRTPAPLGSRLRGNDGTEQLLNSTAALTVSCVTLLLELLCDRDPPKSAHAKFVFNGLLMVP
jgi:hypothetical protein